MWWRTIGTSNRDLSECGSARGQTDRKYPCSGGQPQSRIDMHRSIPAISSGKVEVLFPPIQLVAMTTRFFHRSAAPVALPLLALSRQALWRERPNRPQDIPGSHEIADGNLPLRGDFHACPCMFDCPARINVFSGLASAWLAIPDSKPRTHATAMCFTLGPSLLKAALPACFPG